MSMSNWRCKSFQQIFCEECERQPAGGAVDIGVLLLHALFLHGLLLQPLDGIQALYRLRPKWNESPAFLNWHLKVNFESYPAITSACCYMKIRSIRSKKRGIVMDIFRRQFGIFVYDGASDALHSVQNVIQEYSFIHLKILLLPSHAVTHLRTKRSIKDIEIFKEKDKYSNT